MALPFSSIINQAQGWLAEPVSVAGGFPGTVAAAPAAATPGILASFLQPFKTTFESFAKVGPTMATAAGQGLTTVLLQKAGLIPVPKNEGTQTVIYYEKAQQGTAPPTNLSVVMPTTEPKTSGFAGAYDRIVETTKTNWSAIALVAIALAGLIYTIKGKK